MIRTITLYLTLLISTSCLYAQKTYIIKDFSDKYYAKVYTEDSADIVKQGWTAVYETATNKELIKVESPQLYLSLHDDQLVSNIVELPYGEHSILIYDDFNFDGIKDLAIMDGQNSCYGGPSFQIFLGTNDGFEHSEPFTRLAQEYCGMFSWKAENKRLSTMTKSGCCWHQYSEYIVENNEPVAIKVVEEGMSANGITWDYDIEERVGKEMKQTSYSMLDIENLEQDVIFSFQFKNKKVLRLIRVFNDAQLAYFFTDKDNKVELQHTEFFSYSTANNTLQFTIDNTTYTIYKEGIKVKTPTRKLDMKATEGSIKGSLSTLKDMELENVAKE